MSSIDNVRFIMQKIAAKKEVAKQQQHKGKSFFKTEQTPEEQQFTSLESRFLLNFHAANSVASLINIGKYVNADVFGCNGVVILRIVGKGLTFRLYFRGTTPCDVFESYKMSDFDCVKNIITERVPVHHNDETGRGLNYLSQWKPVFGYIPDIVVGIPILVAGEVTAVVALSFKNKIPLGFWERKVPTLMDSLGVLVPYALIVQGHSDDDDAVGNYTRVLESVDKVEKEIATFPPEVALTNLGTEIARLANCKNLTVFIIDEGDRILRKHYTNFGHPGRGSCPSKKVHHLMEIPMKNEVIAPLAWVATHKSGMRINHLSDFSDFGITAKTIHSIGNCNTRALLIVPVVDYSGESALVIELADKEKGFTHKEYEMVLLFCQNCACLLTVQVLLDRRERNLRRRNIINEMLCSITTVKHAAVEQFITHHRKTSMVFRGRFDDFSLCIRCLPEQDIAGIALEIFYELDIVKDFKIRRSILVRFIISVQQGYGPLPYHNWYHAVSVTHAAYLIVKKLKLIEQGHLNKLEAFALVVSALTHDIDHRGTNNRFQTYTNSDIFKLYNCEDAVMERHHLSIALAILHREDCNILESFNDTDYKYFVELLTWNIIATDISKHMKTREQLFIEAKSSNMKERKLAKLSLFMTAADLCDNCKKWDDSLPTVKGILQEFFNQGDMERQLGFQPIPMMDRHVAYIPLIEYKFLKFIVLPVYRFLASLYDEMRPSLENILNNEDLWTYATKVFDDHKGWDPFEVLELPEMKEAALRKIKFNEPLDTVKHRKFSLATQPPPSPSVTETKSEGKLEVKPGAITLESLGKKSLNMPVEEVEPEEVDTGEKREQKICKRLGRSICCCYRGKARKSLPQSTRTSSSKQDYELNLQ